MAKIEKIRSIILSSYYGFEGCAENILHLPYYSRPCSMVEITLDNGVKGIGEGYLGVFAPEVFTSIINLISPFIVGNDISCGYSKTLTTAKTTTAYWSLQGAAQHVISAIEIALVDVYSKLKEIPAIDLFGGKKRLSIPMYGSGGDSLSPKYMKKELQDLYSRGISIIKIRARYNQADKIKWTINAGKKLGIKVAIDMTQNLVIEGQTIEQVLNLCACIRQECGEDLVFIEECLGLDKLSQLPKLAKTKNITVAGGEIVTTKEELYDRIVKGYYNIVQPDASVLGGIEETIHVCNFAHKCHVQPVVHSWGGAVSMMANYIAAFATNCDLIEYPMPFFEIRSSLFPWNSHIKDGEFYLPDTIGLGISIDENTEKRFPFKAESVYQCFPNKLGIQKLEKSHLNWK